MRRRPVYALAVLLLVLAVVLAAIGVGEQAGKLTDWQAFTLGIVQGLTELLPISSSGHLILVPWLFDWHYLETHSEFNKTFDVALHLGTLVAVVVYFWQEVVLYVGAWFRSVAQRAIRTPDEKIAWLVFVASVPAAIAGVAGESTIEKHLGQPWQIAINLAVFAVVLWIADRSAQTRKLEDIGLWTAVSGGRRAGDRAHAGRVALGDHDLGRPLPEARPRQRRAPLVLPTDPDRLRRGASTRG